ncbi:MAG: peptidoglycan-binding domain-containing protein [Propionibacteriaceae bacterium]|nr:peptidoglycan-binding domain-containing protein [Propionibacteriaceae bacterium]
MGRSIPVSVTVRRPVEVVAQNALSGVVTQVNAGTVEQGGVLYVVGETKVRALSGDRPFWRDLGPGVSGSDVSALQQGLMDLGYLAGGTPSGKYASATRAAVSAWQRDLGHPRTGRVGMGEVVAVRGLPQVVALGEDIKVGHAVSGGEDAVLASTGALEFWLNATAEQAQLIPRDAVLEVSFGEHRWSAVIAEGRPSATGGTDFTLNGGDGGPVCGQECGVLPPEEQQTLMGRAVIVPEASGIGVPAAAIHSRPDGSTYVTTQDGEVPVEVTAASQGIAIVTGVDEGTSVRLGSE